MILAFLSIVLLSSNPPVTSPVAMLRVDGDESTFMVKLTEDATVGYQIAIDCTEKCAKPVHYSEATSDAPLGFFSRDQNDLIFSTWSGGSAYRVRVWSVAGDTVRKIAEMSSRSTPDFLTDFHGTVTIQTYEGDSVAARLRRVRWTFVNGHFVRSKANGS